jgi:manganese/zinc/iron transport system substrate-binding protein
MKTLFSAVAMCALCVVLTGCGHAASEVDPGSKGAIQVLCTTGQVGDMIRNIGGSHVRVETLMGPTVDPHTYRAQLGDSKKLEAADIVFYNGLHLEGRMDDVLKNLAKRKPAIAVAEGVRDKSPDRLRKPPEFEGGFDPHVWFDASLWAECTKYATEKLAEFDPAHADEYRRNGDAYVKQLLELHEECRQKLAQIPPEQRVLITAHDAFGYLGRAYDIEVHGLQGISTVDEPDLEWMNKLVDLLVARKVKAVFVEQSVPEKNVVGLIERCERRGHKIIKGPTLFSDDMGPPGTPEETYIGTVRYNVEKIVEALK